MKELVVNADDFGRSAAINRGIVEAHERGIVTSASLMVRWPDAVGAAAYARSRPGLDVGLHLDLGEWRYRAGGWAADYEVVDQTDVGAVEEEVDQQLRAFHALLGRQPTHLDSHQHVHLNEPMRTVVTAAARALDVPARRLSSRIVYRGDFYGQTGEGEPFPEGIRRESLLRILSTLRDGLTELACHPGIGETESAYGRERAVETEVLCDPAVRETLRRFDVELRSFDGLHFEEARN